MGRFFYTLFLIFGLIVSAFSQNQEVTRIPFVLNNNHIFIKVRVNNSPLLNFMFDSGAGGILINKNVSDSLGLEAATERTNTGAVGTHTVSILKGNTVYIGDTQINNINMMRDENEFEEMDNGEEIAGIIGFHILSRFVVRVDYDNEEIVLYNRSNYVYDGNGIVVPIVLTYNLPIVVSTVKINETLEIEGFFLVDTGARSDLILSSPTVDKYNIIDAVGDYYVLRTEVGSSGKKAKIIFGRVKGLKFGGKDFTNVPTVLSQAEFGVLSFDGINGIIGNRILKRYNITFDYQRSLIYLEPNKNMDKKFMVNVSGFSIVFKNGKPIIKDVIDHSPATRAGLKNGDEIIAIGGKVVEDMKPDEIRSSFTSIKKDNLELVIRRGSKLKYTEIKLKQLI